MDLNAELLLRYNRPGPRYTSYPTAPIWDTAFPQRTFDDALRALEGPASVYVHVPFCERQCTFCGCNMAVAGRREPGTRYLDDLARYLESMPLPSDRLEVQRIHLGGGTPTWLSPDELARLYTILYTRFDLAPGAEVSIEAEPAVTTNEQLDVLAGMGVNRLSLGVQSFDPKVLEVVNRPQDYALIAGLVEHSRALGMGSLNLDLMYGLPYQTLDSFDDTLTQILTLRPDRLAVFGYAHVPWLRPHQKKMPAEALPGPVDRVRLFLRALERLTVAGYQAVGMDHFALPDDEMATAQRAGALHRNFMGYTTMPDVALIGLGMSAISELGPVYAQAHPKLAPWWRAVEAGDPVIEKGFVMSAEDALRKDVIYGLMCNFTVPYAPIEAKHGIVFRAHFAAELSALDALEADGLVERHADRLQVTDRGRLLVRNVAMAFDAYLKQPSDRPRYSQTV